MLFYFTPFLTTQLGFAATIQLQFEVPLHSLPFHSCWPLDLTAAVAPWLPLVAKKGTKTVTELAILASVRCIVGVNTAVQLYRGESLQP